MLFVAVFCVRMQVLSSSLPALATLIDAIVRVGLKDQGLEKAGVKQSVLPILGRLLKPKSIIVWLTYSVLRGLAKNIPHAFRE